ncbi:serine acetyltransferase [Stutzerimonas nitrititolerans]|uniref:serine acetyltransferase n=1 Tax=Stutzerimonas nitrititolerans TaxID=2482751 RepID=UPI0028A1F02D|nr:DapH/DapD/GlmU-related protein [Stutzerimonas nitrititolerans]
MPKTVEELKKFWHIEILGGSSKFSWLKLYRRVSRSNSSNCLFWLRLSQYLYGRGNRTLKSYGKRINKSLTRKFGVEIMPGAEIDIGLSLGHPIAIVVSRAARIGKNCSIRQCTTIGLSHEADAPFIHIGDNVNIGAHTCIMGTHLTIGDNVTIGAASFVNKDIPSDMIYITRKESTLRPKG